MVDMNTMDYSRELMDLYGIPELYDALPKLATEPTEIVGTVTKEASEITGLAEGTPVAAGMMDILACLLVREQRERRYILPLPVPGVSMKHIPIESSRMHRPICRI